MTDRNHSEFENLFDNAAQRIHHEMPRGNGPSAKVWQTVLGESTNVRSEAHVEVSASAEQPVPPISRSTSRQSRLGSRAMPVGHDSQPDYLQWTSWVAVVAIVAAIGFGFYTVTRDEPGNRQQSIALAPTTPDVDQGLLNEIASPVASPFVQTYDPAFACNVEPLAEDVVYQMVVNPFQFTQTRSYVSTPPARAPYGWETDGRYRETQALTASSRDQMEPVDDPALRQELASTADEFWNCLMTGSALQVWALMDPTAVQHEVLTYLPVIRDEAMVRQYISEWGPRRYSAGLTMVFPDLGNVYQIDASKHADETWDSILVGYTIEGDPWRAEVLMVPHPDSGSNWSVRLALTPAPDGRWWVATFYGAE